MLRCNKPANIYSPLNGFTICDDHHKENNPEIVTEIWYESAPCDVAIETREEFWKRHPNSRMYRKLFATK